jgi:hypothetical protein
MNVYQYFYRPCYDTACNFTGLFGFIGDSDSDLAGVIQADNEYQAEARARIKQFERFKKHFNFVTGVEITKVLQIS